MPIPESEEIARIVEGLKQASDWDYQGTTDTMPKGALTTAEARTLLTKLVVEARLNELEKLPVQKEYDEYGNSGKYIEWSDVSKRLTALRKENGSDE